MADIKPEDQCSKGEKGRRTEARAGTSEKPVERREK